MKLSLRYALFLSIAVLLVACNSDDVSNKYNEVRERAENAAASVVAADEMELMELQGRILAAKSVQSEYILLGDTAAADTFDVTFRRYVERNNRKLAGELFQESTARKN